ncbi:MAG: diphosphate--fructose-6-phosphate 1-phosphotransferase [Bacteroidaceae bacterium]|nr:diphosphate--fructose-6-phosphate 1-phosphotransferase [Bacteroidaceae bacterium]
MDKSRLELLRHQYEPRLPMALRGIVDYTEGEATQSAGQQDEIQKMFPHTYGLPTIHFHQPQKGETDVAMPTVDYNIGVLLSGGQAPGGHNVITGLFDKMQQLAPQAKLYGFLGGPDGLVKGQYRELTRDIINDYRNTGGFDMIGSGRTKLEEVTQFEQARQVMESLNVKALVIIGGDDSNTNACVLAEYYAAQGIDIRVVGCPKTIDGDLKNSVIETSFGFDTATKIYAELVGNIERDCLSAHKYWHFIRLMGRSASHIALECALRCHPNICLISEEVAANDISLNDIVAQIADVVARRAAKGMNYGVVLVPEGLIEFVPAIGRLIAELNTMLANEGDTLRGLTQSERHDYLMQHLTADNAQTFATLPTDVAEQLSLERDPHGNVQVSLIETEKLLSFMVAQQLKEMKEQGRYSGKFSPQHHFFGYEGRCGAPSNFDANYCYGLGMCAMMLIAHGKTGYMAVLNHLTDTPEEWLAGGAPITMMMNMERRSGKMKPVIKKALVDLEGAPFQHLQRMREEWADTTAYLYPGPIQYFGPSALTDAPTRTLIEEQTTNE